MYIPDPYLWSVASIGTKAPADSIMQRFLRLLLFFDCGILLITSKPCSQPDCSCLLGRGGSLTIDRCLSEEAFDEIESEQGLGEEEHFIAGADALLEQGEEDGQFAAVAVVAGAEIGAPEVTPNPGVLFIARQAVGRTR